jgi:hypothetical protein
VTLFRCYRATCDAPGCPSVEYLPHERSGAARLQLSLLGWTAIEYRVSASGAARLVYACPAHRDWQPSDDGRRRWFRIRRAAMLWMLYEAGVSWQALAGCMGITAPRVKELADGYDRVICRRRLDAANWVEPWAKRLREAGAIP